MLFVIESKEFLRALFNGLNLESDTEKKLFWVGKENPIFLPNGSQSELWEYIGDDPPRRIALVHLYRLNTGEPYGIPDPKQITYGVITFYV